MPKSPRPSTSQTYHLNPLWTRLNPRKYLCNKRLAIYGCFLVLRATYFYTKLPLLRASSLFLESIRCEELEKKPFLPISRHALLYYDACLEIEKKGLALARHS